MVGQVNDGRRAAMSVNTIMATTTQITTLIHRSLLLAIGHSSTGDEISTLVDSDTNLAVRRDGC
jgi:hypothetical protein